MHHPVYTDEELVVVPCERETNTVRAGAGHLPPHSPGRPPFRACQPAPASGSVRGGRNRLRLWARPRLTRSSQIRDKLAYQMVSAARYLFDKGTGYGGDSPMTEAKWLQRFIFLETVAAIPGMVGGAVRHLHSLRLMKRDGGWIHTLLEEAENERMHLLTFIQLRDPGALFRLAVLGAQGLLFNVFFASYLLSPKTVHRFVGHLEEQAVKTYTHAIQEIEEGKLPAWTNLAPPDIAMDYWKLKEGAVMRDLLLAVRADEACHSHVNHTFASLPQRAVNPFKKGQHNVPLVFVEPPPGIDMNTGLAFQSTGAPKK